MCIGHDADSSGQFNGGLTDSTVNLDIVVVPGGAAEVHLDLADTDVYFDAFLLFFARDNMTTAPQYIYDQFPYEGFPITQTHPDRIIPTATLLGMSPAPATKCRVLELGCGDGANLIPMAAVLTESEFLGLDLAANPIVKASAMAKALGLANARFEQKNVMDVDGSLGEFDYIIAHGLYSWVPATVRDKVMSVCQSLLSAQGVAYISYNVYPGCHLRKMMSGMMFYHVQGVEEPRERVSKAAEVLSFLAAGKPDAPGLADELKQLKERRAYSILHDDLSETNDPVYFHEFAAHAERNGMQYLAESDFFEMQPYNFSAAVQKALEGFAGGDVIRFEQYLDFLKNRRFRKTLLCRRDVPLTRGLIPKSIRGFYAASVARAVSHNPDIASNKEEEFRGSKGGALRTGHPALKAAMVDLGARWPVPVNFAALLDAAGPYLAVNPESEDGAEESTDLFCEMLMRCFTAGMLEFHALPGSFSVEVSGRPCAFSYARLQAMTGDQAVCNLRHTTIELDEPSLHLLQLLDGTRDLEAIHQGLMEAGITAASGKAVELSEVRDNIKKMAQAALLVS